MFESAELGLTVDKEAYKEQELKLRTELLAAQRELASAGSPVLLLVSGVEGGGKTTLVNTLLDWLDARGVEINAPWLPTDEERERPPFWRFWRMLPPGGKLGIFLGSWYTAPIVSRVFGEIGEARYASALDRIEEFERMLAAEGAVFVKLWLHLSEKAQKERFKELESKKATRGYVTERDWEFHKLYPKFRRVSEHAIRKTSTAQAPWQVVDATDRRHVALTAGRALLAALRARLDRPAPKKAERKLDLPKPRRVNILRRLDQKSTLAKKAYEKRLEREQGRIARLTRKLRDKGRSMILVFEGPDAAGKGGAIRRLLRAMDARIYRVSSFAAPTDEERAHPYLWRFWRNLPRHGRVAVYDRSWYGRVLVERIEGFAAPEEWKRAYAEINAFEEQLAEHGTLVLKFWIHITPDEQLRRFQERQTTPYKQYKLTEEDWRNRKKWEGYEAAACEMIERTSTTESPWVPVAGNDKRRARVAVAKAVADLLDDAVG